MSDLRRFPLLHSRRPHRRGRPCDGSMASVVKGAVRMIREKGIRGFLREIREEGYL